MKKNKIIAGTITFFVLGFMGFTTAHAATNPNLGAASSFSILGQTAITGISTISGDVGMNSTGASITALTTPNVAGTIYSSDGVATLGAPPAATIIINPAVQANASTVFTVTIPGLPIEGTPIVGVELNGITRGPGVYDLAGDPITLSGGVLTLDGPGTYIFRTTGNLTSSGSINFINGARACDLFWNVGSDATINGTSFAGTILALAGIHFGPGVTLDGRALAVGADVTLGVGGTISGPSCAPPVPPVPPAPAPAPSMGGIFPTLPSIALTKTPSRFDVPFGSSTVIYTYEVINPAKVNLSYVKLIDDKCSPVLLVSGDLNNNNILETTEKWTYTCASVLTQTTTNVATVTGFANGSIATAIAQNTVIVSGTSPTPTPSIPNVPTVLGASSSTVPSFPNTGFGPGENITLWELLLSISIVGSLLLLPLPFSKKLFKK